MNEMQFSQWESLWETVYDDISDIQWRAICRQVWQSAIRTREKVRSLPQSSPVENASPHSLHWYDNLLIYALYPQHFNSGISGISQRLDYLEKLGVNCLWLLPMLESPMLDEGFDISDYRRIRSSLFPQGISESQKSQVFADLVSEADSRDIALIFDIALNHVSRDHHWFQEASANRNSKYRDYFIWNDDTELYSEARIIFKGLLNSNWSWDRQSEQYYFHRFYPHQPDLNYRNPRVLQEIIDVLFFWARAGIRGFRVDAAPYLWKEPGTGSENLPKTHEILKIIRAAVDLLERDIMLLAEAGQPPNEVVAYFGDDDECQGAYHFPLMPRMYRSILEKHPAPLLEILKPEVTPEIPHGCRWFTFLRLHDELTLEMVSPEERSFLHKNLCHDPSWDFREGEGISARISELFMDPGDVLFAHLLLLGLQGNPILYYGDEVLVQNNIQYAEAQKSLTGYNDSRNLVRGPLDWDDIDGLLQDSSDIRNWHFRQLAFALSCRKQANIFTYSHGESRSLCGGASSSVLQIDKYDDANGESHRYSLLYNFSAEPSPPLELVVLKAPEYKESQEKNAVSDKSGSLKPILYWDGSLGTEVDVSLVPDLEIGNESMFILPARSVLWLGRS